VFAAIDRGDAKVACCQPADVSPENVTVPSKVPLLVHRWPTWVPVLPVPL
jgi:hypothetical protein